MVAAVVLVSYSLSTLPLLLSSNTNILTSIVLVTLFKLKCLILNKKVLLTSFLHQNASSLMESIDKQSIICFPDSVWMIQMTQYRHLSSDGTVCPNCYFVPGHQPYNNQLWWHQLTSTNITQHWFYTSISHKRHKNVLWGSRAAWGGGSLTKEINLVKILIFAFKYFIIFCKYYWLWHNNGDRVFEILKPWLTFMISLSVAICFISSSLSCQFFVSIW